MLVRNPCHQRNTKPCTSNPLIARTSGIGSISITGSCSCGSSSCRLRSATVESCVVPFRGRRGRFIRDLQVGGNQGKPPHPPNPQPQTRRLQSLETDHEDKAEWLVLFPEIDRNSVLQTFRFLLSKAKGSCGVTREGLSTTQARHKAFLLLLEEDPDLHSVASLNEVTATGKTSTEQLRETCLNQIQSASNADIIKS